MAATSEPLAGRRAEAARNDRVILEAARTVFVADSGAPISAVAKEAKVGIAALYRRYPSKEHLLRKLCSDGLAVYIGLGEAALADDGDPWTALVRFMEGVVDADTNSLTRALAGTFVPSEDLYRDSERAQELNIALFERVRAAGRIREDLVVDDLALVHEIVSAVRVGDPDRTAVLRRRYLALLLQGLRDPSPGPLPGPPPNGPELGERWNT
jgi:AcrR family transcriptional regulator